MADYNLTSANSGPALDAILEKAKTSLQPGAVALADVTGLDTALAGKSDTTHTHTGTYQPADADLTAIAGLTSAADKVPYFTGAGTADLASLTQAGRAVIAGADAAAQRSALGLGTSATLNTGTVAGTVCTGNDARLSDARTPAAHTVGSHSDWPAAVSATEVGYLDGVTSAIQTQLDGKSETGHTHTAANISDSTAAGRALLTAADAGVQRTTMGLLDASTHASTDFATAAQGALASSAQQPNAAASFLETVITANSANAALRVTQTGAGDVVRFEDAANPDSTPFVIDAAGNVGVGTTTISAKAHVLATTEQLRLGYDATHYSSFTVSASGMLTVGGAGRTIGVYVPAPSDGGVSSDCFYSGGTIGSGVTSKARGFVTYPATQAASFTLGSLHHFVATQNTIGSGSAVTTQVGFRAESTLAGAATNIGFQSILADASANWNFYASGTAQNYFAGNVGIGTSTISAKAHVLATTEQLRLGYDATKYASFTVDASGNLSVAPTGALRLPGRIGINAASESNISLYDNGALNGSTSAYGIVKLADAESTVTNQAFGFYSLLGTQAASFTLGTLAHFVAEARTKGAGSTITTHTGFIASSSLTTGATNLGFAGYIPAGVGRWNFYADGTAQNYFSGNVGIGTTAISAKLHVIANSDHLRLGYDATNFTAFSVESDGTLYIAPVSGYIKYGTWTSSNDAAVNGYMVIKDAAGTIRKLATIA